jgi:acyl-CoA oxidase
MLHLLALSLTDILTCSQKFWDMQSDPILVRDIGCTNIIACNLNLFVGTVAPFAHKRPDLKALLTKALNFDIIGNLLLTEVGHGLDISSLETTATKVEDGFVLHTPHPDAAK